MERDLIVLGAGPAGLGAALAAARDGARVTVVEAAERVGGLCVTLRRDGLAYDLGGHILFVHDEARRAWLEEMLDGDLLWVDRPVVCVRDGRILPGRYLDQRPDRLPANPAGDGRSAREFLDGLFGGEFVDRAMRRYLEKVDGMPLERIVAARPHRLMIEQYAPRGFFYPAQGIGQLMEAMAAHVTRRGGAVMTGHRVARIAVRDGRVSQVRVEGPDGPVDLTAPRVVAGLPPALVARLVDPPPDPDVVPALAARAAALVYLELPRDRVTDHAWIQVDDPRVPFARLFEAKNWSARLVPPGRTVLGCECYGFADPSDPWWALPDTDLAAACARALVDPLRLIADAGAARMLEVVRLPHAWSVVDVDGLESAARPARWLAGIEGLAVAQGGDVVLAIAAGEAAATP